MADPLDSLLLHPITFADAKNFIKSPGHVLLLVGVQGSGKDTLAKAIATSVLKLDLVHLKTYPYYINIELQADKQDISIIAIRDALRKLNLKVQGKSSIRRVIVINDAQLMSHAAQNSLLKNLEEPASDTIFILTAPSKISLLPTIVSRTWQLNVHPVDLVAALAYYSDKFSEASINSMWMLCGGSVGLLSSLLNESDHPLKIQISEAKKLLQLNSYERLLALNAVSKDKTHITNLLDALSRLLVVLQHGPNNCGSAAVNRLLYSRKLIIKLQQAMANNVNSRLVALVLALNLKI